MPKKKKRAESKQRFTAPATAGTILPKASAGQEQPAPGSPADAAERKSRRGKALPWAAFFMALTLCIVWIGAHAYLIDTVTVRLCEDADKNLPKEKRMPVFLSEIAFDGYVWNRHAEDLGKHGDFRVRWTDFDNAPYGREVHWNSAFAWYLRALGEIYRMFTGDSLRNSIYRMSIWANPILLVIAVGVFSTLSARRFGPLCGAVIAVGMVAVPTFYEGFLPAYPDHHGLIAFCLLGLLFGIAWAGAGWVKAGSGGANDLIAASDHKQARHGMLFSAICGAAGLWISALSTAIVLGSIGAAALLTGLVHARAGSSARAGKPGEATLDPELWRYWAKRGAAFALGFYLLEYFPFHMGLRLEVNHPFYALAWLGGGWVLAEILAWLRDPKIETFPLKKILLPAVACLPLPAIILLGGPEVYIPKDPFMARLWKNIAELLPLLKRIEFGGLTWATAIGWFPMLVAAAITMQFFKRVGRGSKATLLFLSVPIFLITALQFYQVRWGMLVGPLYIALAGIAIPQVWSLVPKDLVARTLVGIILAGFGYYLIQPAFRNSFHICWTQFRQKGQTVLTPGQALALLHRQMARAILDDAAGRPVVLLSSPNSSCLLAAIGGFKTIGTLYWENVDGLKNAALALNAQSDEETRERIEKHGVTHVSTMTWENFIGPYFQILYPSPVLGKSYEKSFAKRALFDNRIPSFTRPLPFPANKLTSGLQQRVMMLAYDPGMKPHEAAYHHARYNRLFLGNDFDAEFALGDILKSEPGFTPARIELAKLLLAQRRYKEMAATLSDAFPDDPGMDAIRRAATLATEGKRPAAIEALKEAAASGNPDIKGAAENFLHLLQPPTP